MADAGGSGREEQIEARAPQAMGMARNRLLQEAEGTTGSWMATRDLTASWRGRQARASELAGEDGSGSGTTRGRRGRRTEELGGEDVVEEERGRDPRALEMEAGPGWTGPGARLQREEER